MNEWKPELSQLNNRIRDRSIYTVFPLYIFFGNVVGKVTLRQLLTTAVEVVFLNLGFLNL